MQNTIKINVTKIQGGEHNGYIWLWTCMMHMDCKQWLDGEDI